MKCLELLELSKAKRLLLIFFLLFSFSYGDTVIYLKKEVFLNKKSITLSDIATVQSNNPIFKSFLENIHISQFSETTVITSQQIKNILEKNYINLDFIKIVGKKVEIKRKTSFVTHQYIRDKIVSYLSSEYKDIKIENVRCSFTPFKTTTTPETKLSLRSKSSSHIYLTVTLFYDEIKTKKINCTVKYLQMINGVVAKRDLMKGQIITQDDVEIKKVRFKKEIVTQIETVNGAVVKRFIKKGEPIKASMIDIDYPVKKRDYVKVIYDRNGIKIEITGQALQNGVIGQNIKVKNVSSGKLLRCKVIGRNTVLFISGY